MAVIKGFPIFFGNFFNIHSEMPLSRDDADTDSSGHHDSGAVQQPKKLFNDLIFMV
jgi:hypothetical protein